jgi:hypothetical protein
MSESQESKDIPPMFNDEWAQAWMEEHRTELEQYVSSQRILYWSLGISFVLGLAAHVGGYVLLSSAPSGLLGLLADLLHALGWSLWTGVVVAVFVQIIPEAKQRQIKRALDAYEALRREKAQASGPHDRAVLERPHARRVEREQGPKRARNRARKEGG